MALGSAMVDVVVTAALEKAAQRQKRLAELEAALPDNEQWRTERNLYSDLYSGQGISNTS